MSSVALSPKKLRELHLLTGFSSAAGLGVRVVDADRESPDFIVEFEGRQIGVEVTELFVGGGGRSLKPQARTSVATRIATRARRRYEELGGKPVRVTIGLTLGEELRHANRDRLAQSLAEFLLALDPPLDQVISWRPSYKEGPLPPEVHYLEILAVPSWSMAHWYVPESGWMAPLDEAVLQASVDDKAGNLSDYQRVTPEVWLLLATGGWSASQFFEIRSDLRPDRVNSPFSRTYYYSAFGGRVVRLGVPRDA